jgi:3-isopropylmalate/(R)-2-methylmalate dehydratase large subunit
VGILKGVAVFKQPETLRINLNDSLKDGVFAKDVILSVIATIGVSGATDKVIEFRGRVIDGLSMEGRMTICNMAVEAGATCGMCQPDKTTAEYLWKFIGPDGDSVYSTKEEAVTDFTKWYSDKDAVYTGVVDLDCSALEPCATVGYKPDEVKPIRELAGTKIDQVYIGSCTNGRIEDLREAAKILKGKKIAGSVRGIVSPATPAVYEQALKEGLIETFMSAGFCVTNPTCGACLGMSNGVLAAGEVCASTTNRNFFGRMGKGGMVHLMSPASAAAAAVAGVIGG